MVGSTKNVNFDFNSLNGIKNTPLNNKINISSKNISNEGFNYDEIDYSSYNHSFSFGPQKNAAFADFQLELYNSTNSNYTNGNSFSALKSNEDVFKCNDIETQELVELMFSGKDAISKEQSIVEKGIASGTILYGKVKTKKYIDDYINNEIKINPFSLEDKFAMSQTEDLMNEVRLQNTGPNGEIIHPYIEERLQDKELKKEVYELCKKNYNTNMHSIIDIDKQAEELGKMMDKEISLANGDQAKISEINRRYQPKFEELEAKRSECLNNIADGKIDPNKIKVEKSYYGNTASEVKSFASSSGIIAVITFVTKEITTGVTVYIEQKQKGKTDDQAFWTAVDSMTDIKGKFGQNLTESVSLGLGNFAGLFFSHGNASVGSAGGVVASNIAGLAFKYILATDEERARIIDEELKPTLSGTALAAGSSFVSFASGVTGNILGRDLYELIDLPNNYESLDDFIANADPKEVSSKILELTGSVVGDLLEYNYTKKTTGVLASGLSAAGNAAGNYLGEFGVNLGYWYYDAALELEEFGATAYDFTQYVKETGVAGFTECWVSGFRDFKELWLSGLGFSTKQVQTNNNDLNLSGVGLSASQALGPDAQVNNNDLNLSGVGLSASQALGPDAQVNNNDLNLSGVGLSASQVLGPDAPTNQNP